MSLTQEGVLAFLLERGGQVSSSELLAEFGGLLRSGDPARAAHLRATFKRCVDNVAVVKEMDGVKHVVVKKVYVHMLRRSVSSTAEESGLETDVNAHNSSPGSTSGSSTSPDGTPCFGDSLVASSSSLKCSDKRQSGSAAEMALRRCRSSEKPKKEAPRVTAGASQSKWMGLSKDPSGVRADVVRKPYALPLRMPPSQMDAKVPTCAKEELSKKTIPEENLCLEAEELRGLHLSYTRKRFESAKTADKQRYSENVPLEAAGHDWLMKTALGQWHQVHALLLQDTQLAEKRDFLSGFTVLHWAVKLGNTDMISTVIEVAKRAGTKVDVNRKSYGGYTPLHIAAIHDHEAAIALLVNHYGADRDIRDNSGKKPCHYLHKHVSPEVRELLGVPRVLQHQTTPSYTEVDHFTETVKGFNTISKLFQPYSAVHRKRHKRPEMHLVSENPDSD